MEQVISQTHIAIIPDSTEQVSVLGMKMLKQMQNNNLFEIGQFRYIFCILYIVRCHIC